MIGILLCMVFFGVVAGFSYYFAYSDAERSRRAPAPRAGQRRRQQRQQQQQQPDQPEQEQQEDPDADNPFREE